MSLLTWTKEQFGTNVTMHDQEHQTIFRMLNELHESTADGDRNAVGSKLDELIAFVADHFGSEERNMLKVSYPDYERHKQEHDNLVLICLDLQKQFHAGKTEITSATTGFVKDWLVNHVPNVDRRYGPALNGAGIA
jgi:hemerythrin